MRNLDHSERCSLAILILRVSTLTPHPAREMNKSI